MAGSGAGPGTAALYARILSFLRPHLPVLAVAVAATFVFAVADAAVYILLIPFVDALFVSGGGAPASGGGSPFVVSSPSSTRGTRHGRSGTACR